MKLSAEDLQIKNNKQNILYEGSKKYKNPNLKHSNVNLESEWTIYLIIPAYNESKVIEHVIDGLKDRDLNIIVVDDGSSDKTYKMASELLKNMNGFVYRHSLNRGVGAAIKTGIKVALTKKANIIVTFDADGQHDPDDILSLCIPIMNGEADVVNGYRNFDEMPVSKKLGNQIMNVITRVFYGIGVNDSQSGFKAFSKNAAEVLEINSRGFGVISEIMGEVKKHDLKLKEVPIKTIYTDYSMTKGTNLKVGLKILFRLIINLFKKVLA